MRNTYQLNSTFKLLIQITDSDGESFDPDDGPYLDLFAPPNDDEDDTTATVLNASQASLGDVGQQGTTFVIKEAVGLYSYIFPIAVDAELGGWLDRWSFIHDGVETIVDFTFTVLENPFVASIGLSNNQLIRITLDSTIAADDDAEDILNEDYVLQFYTVLTPTYASSNMVLMEAGGYLQGIEESDIEVAIYKYSLDADLLTFLSISNRSYYEWVRRQWVICSVARELLINKVNNMVKQKVLGDLSVTYDPTYVNKIKDLTDCVEQMGRMLNSGGLLGPGTSYQPQITVPGISSPDRPDFGRGDSTNPYYRGGGNTNVYETAHNIRTKRTFRPRGSKGNW